MLAIGLGPPALAQQPQRATTRIAYVYPAGGQRGTTFIVTVGGQNLRETDSAWFSGAGIQARVLGFDRPLSQKEFQELQEQLQVLRARRAAARGGKPIAARRSPASAPSPALDEPPATAGSATRSIWTGADEKQFDELRAKLGNRANRNANPALSESVTLEVIVAADAATENRTLRLKAAAGLSNPLTFQIGELPEFTGPAITSKNAPPDRPPREAKPRGMAPAAPKPPTVTLPATLNGQIMPGEVDRYRFAARAGQQITVIARARALIPYLADAVPGWFQATLALYDASGRELAYEDDFRFNPDPVLAYRIPADGDYTIEIKDSIFRGREDFVYRIAIGELPFITSVFPLGGQTSVLLSRNAADKRIIPVSEGGRKVETDVPAGLQAVHSQSSPPRTSGSTSTATLRLSGWNLPSASLELNLAGQPSGTLPLTVRHQNLVSNTVGFVLDPQPGTLEAEPNSVTAQAQSITTPITVNGRIDQPGDEDVFRFTGQAGATLVAEVFARRLNSPLDSALTLFDSAGRQLGFNDDSEDRGAGLITHHADARLSLTLPADDTYTLRLADTQRQGGAEFGYRLRVGPPRPDFALRVVPSSINAPAGSHVPVTVYAVRRDGFAGEIQLALRDAPEGFALSGARIPAGGDRIQLTLRAPATNATPMPLVFVGRATIAGQSIERAAVPAEDMMQAFAYHHLVAMPDLLVNTARRGIDFRVLSPLPLQIPATGSLRVTLAVGPAGLGRQARRGESAVGTKTLESFLAGRGISNLECKLLQPPAGLVLDAITIDDREIQLSFTAQGLRPGQQGNLIVALVGERTPPGEKPNSAQPRRAPLGCAPAIPFEVIAAVNP